MLGASLSTINHMKNSLFRNWTTLGIALIVVSVAALAADRSNPRNFRSSPEDLRSPQVSSVWMSIYDAAGNSVSYSALGRKASMGVGYDNQIGANDCCYWTGDHIRYGQSTQHTEVGYNSYSDPGFVWHNRGSGYDEFEIKVVRVDNGDGFTNGGEENAVITFTGGDVWALVEPSDGEKPSWAPLPGSPPTNDHSHSDVYYVPVFYNTSMWLNGHQ